MFFLCICAFGMLSSIQQISPCKPTAALLEICIFGCSMAAPHVAGVAAIYLADHPAATASEVKHAIIRDATSDKVLHCRLLFPACNKVTTKVQK